MADQDLGTIQNPAGLGNEARLLENENLVRTVRELLGQINAAMEGLREMGVVNNRNSAVEGVAQLIACACLDLTPAAPNQKGYDAKDAEGCHYEIKGIGTDDNNRETSPISDPSCFDYLVLVVFATDFRVRFILNFPKDSLIKNRAVFKWRSDGKGYVALNRDTPRVEGAQDLLDEFRQRFPFWDPA